MFSSTGNFNKILLCALCLAATAIAACASLPDEQATTLQWDERTRRLAMVVMRRMRQLDWKELIEYTEQTPPDQLNATESFRLIHGWCQAAIKYWMVIETPDEVFALKDTESATFKRTLARVIHCGIEIDELMAVYMVYHDRSVAGFEEPYEQMIAVVCSDDTR